jgi:hypothetical protein
MELSPDKKILTDSYTLSDARNACNRYMHLNGREYIRDGRTIGTIITVTVAPYDEVNKWIFLSLYRQHRNIAIALEQYTPPFYDVVLLIELADSQIVMKELSAYLKEIAE